MSQVEKRPPRSLTEVCPEEAGRAEDVGSAPVCPCLVIQDPTLRQGNWTFVSPHQLVSGCESTARAWILCQWETQETSAAHTHSSRGISFPAHFPAQSSWAPLPYPASSDSSLPLLASWEPCLHRNPYHRHCSKKTQPRTPSSSDTRECYLLWWLQACLVLQVSSFHARDHIWGSGLLQFPPVGNLCSLLLVILFQFSSEESNVLFS